MNKDTEEEKVEQENLEIEEVEDEKATKKIQKELQKFKKLRRLKFINSFITKLKDDRMYAICFVICIVFFGTIIFRTVIETGNNYNQAQGNVIDAINDVDVVVSEDEVDVSKYVGTYYEDIKLNESITINKCSMDSYRFVYEVKSDKTITKYLMSDCLGTIKIWDDELVYATTNGTKYIHAKDTNFIFGVNSLKEVDGDSYSLKSISIKENVVEKNVEKYFYGNDIVLVTNVNLYLLKGSAVSFKIPEEYVNNGGNLSKLVYKSASDNNYYFFVFSNGEKLNCYDNDNSNNLVYKIYNVKYNTELGEFGTIRELTSRYRSDGCKTFDSDLEMVKE